MKTDIIYIIKTAISFYIKAVYISYGIDPIWPLFRSMLVKINSLANIDETLTANRRSWNFVRVVIVELRLPRLSVYGGLTRYLVSLPCLRATNDIIIKSPDFF